MSIDLLVFLEEICKFMRSEQKEIKMRRGKWGLREQTEIVDNVDKSVQNSIFPKKGKKWVCKTYPQNWGQNVDNVDNKKVRHIFVQLVWFTIKLAGWQKKKRFTWIGRRRRFTAGSFVRVWRVLFYGWDFPGTAVRLILAGRCARINVKKS